MGNAKILRCKRIERELSHLFEYPLTIVSATMGYGKTTSARTYLSRKRNIQTVWVSLLGSDGDEIVFWHKISSAIFGFNPEIGKWLDRMGFPFDVREVAKVIELLWKLNEGKTKVIVIDDYHLIEQSQALNHFIELIAEEEIPNLHVVLLSRTRPPLNHINLLSKGLCYYVDTNKLSFTLQEVQDYFTYMGFSDLPTKEIKRIYLYTRGWISAIYLILLGLKQDQPITEVTNISLLVRDNLYSTLELHVQQVLLDLSIFDSFTLKQAEKVLKNPEASKIIRQLVEKNAFIEFDRQEKGYKFHNVLLDFLKQEVTDTDRDMRTVCHRAGQWYLDQGDSLTAFDYYHRAGRMEELLDYLNCAEKMKIGYLVGVELLQDIFKDLELELYIKYPFPMMRIALSFFNSGEPTAVGQCLKIISVLESYYSEAEHIPSELRHKILGEIEIINIFLDVNDTHKMVDRSLNADKLLGGNVSYLVLRNSEFTFGLPHFLYTYYRQAGQLKETLDCIEKGFPPKVFDGCGTGCEYVALAEYALETGEVKTAEFYAQKAIYKAKTMQQTGIVLCANFTLMRLQLLQGNFSAAKALLVETREQWLMNPQHEISLQNSVVYNLTMSMCEGYLYSCLNSPELIPQWLQTGDISSRPLMLKGMGFPYIIYVKAILLNESWGELEILCESCESKYLVYHNQLGILHNAIYNAVAKYNLYGMDEGSKVLLGALNEANLDGILLPFAENAMFILPMLYELRYKKECEPAYLDKLIGLCEQYSENLKAESNLISLTQRERQVIGLVAQGLTNRQIAEQLFLSIASIKKHLESIYSKLGVNNKVSAIQRAYKEKLIK